MHLGEVCRLAALTKNDEVGFGLEFLEDFNNVPPLQPGSGLDNARRQEVLYSRVDDQLATFLGQARLLRIVLGKFVQQMAANAKFEAPAPVHRRIALASPNDVATSTLAPVFSAAQAVWSRTLFV